LFDSPLPLPPGVFSGAFTTYLLRNDGSIDYTTGGNTVNGTIDPPEGITYVDCSAGPYASYALRSDGA
jgi:hypothetical protein